MQFIYAELWQYSFNAAYTPTVLSISPDHADAALSPDPMTNINPGNLLRWSIGLWALLFGLLIAPLPLAGYWGIDFASVLTLAANSALLAAFLVLLRRASGLSRLTTIFFWLFLVLVFLIRLTYFLVLDFSGTAFTNNFYTHVSGDAIRIGWEVYAGVLLLAAAFFTLAAVIIQRNGIRPLAGVYAWIPALLSPVVLAWFFLPLAAPEQELARNYLKFREAANPGTLNRAQFDILRKSGLISMEHNDRQAIIAQAAPQPKNLILVYLESFHLAFTDEGPFKDLTPRLNELKREYGYHANWLSSADATMEAILSTQCGTLVSAPQGSNTFANTDSILPNLACLPDILRVAGYQQVFLGGFDKRFSGKAQYFGGHGYDEVMGWEDWQSMGFEARDGYWGLADDLLFEQAFTTAVGLASNTEDRPYNLTLLTLSTHPPGFSSSSCSPYHDNPDGNRIIEAIHCTDQLVGKFVDELLAAGLNDDTTIVLTGDHDIFNLPEVTANFPELENDPRLLTIVIDPDRRFEFHDQINVAYDLAPTILDLLEVEYNTRFIWGVSAFYPRDYAVTRNFRAGDQSDIHFLKSPDRDCANLEDMVTLPLDDCEHFAIVTMSDKYLFSFYNQQDIPLALCDAAQSLQVSVPTGEHPLSIRFYDEEVSGSFAWEGRPLEPTQAGFYLFIKASPARPITFNYFPWDHEYWQVSLVDTLISLDGTDQFVLVWKPAENVAIIPPLEQLMRAWGFDNASLKDPFVVASNGDPDTGQVYISTGGQDAHLSLTSTECASIANRRVNPTIYDRETIDRMLKPFFEKYPTP